MLNPKSRSFKDRGLAEKKITKNQAIGMILEDPTLMKRPLILYGKKYVLGWNSEAYAKVLL